MLSSNYGIYNGFELLEHEPIPGREEYLNSEKYEIKIRDWNAPGNIKPYIAALNRARRENPALLQTRNLRFLPVGSDQIVAFAKQTTDARNTVVGAIALSRDASEFWLPLDSVRIQVADGLSPAIAVENLMTGERHAIEWGGVRLRIDPLRDPALLFRCLA
jgi:starch synthase (maltosyl-transferring)